ncbi:DUF4062 domain-containing protein [Sphingomonas sp. ZT3P38]|uniref:DUF4062 domain-containing protein n=1 Tax=Parasphingomonas zepuensis TaxID=3096161 RepID=UPI002FC81894
MSENIKIVRIFIGSPSGLEDERRAAREIVQEVNQAHSEHWGCQFKLVGWEDTIPGYQRPQSRINVDLDKCQYFVGILWNRWGTKPDLDDSGFTSGFEEEFCRARDLIAAGSMKDIALYFKAVDVPAGLEPGPEIKKVKDFRTQCIDEKRIFFRDFTETADFGDLIRSKVTEIGWREFEIHTPPEPGNSEAEQSPQENAGDKAPADAKFFDQKAIDFISVMSNRSRENEQINPHEVARFRLIAASLQRSGNDELYLGNHDANLIFRHRKEISLSFQESRALVDCGIVGFDHQNVPLWRWLIAMDTKNEPFKRVEILAIIGNTEERKNAIKLLQILGKTVPELMPYFTKEVVLTGWLDSEASNQIFDLAFQFLSYNGTREDVEIIEKIAADAPVDKKAKLDAIVASIKTRSSHEEALKFICASSVEKVPETFVDAIFSTPSALSTDVLALCVAAKSGGVRLRAVKLLIERGELAEAAAHNLLSDSNHQIRLLAVECLQVSDNPLPSDTVRTVLTIKKGGRGLGLLQSVETDATYYDCYLANRLKELDLDQLKERVSEAGVFNDKELFTLYGKFGKKLSDDIRVNLRNRFASMFEASVKKVEAIPGIKEDYRTQIYGIWDFYQKKLCSGALAALCGLKIRTDIGLVRATLDAIEIELSPELLAYLAKFGDWSDVVRIERLASPSSGGPGLLDFSYNTFANEKAVAIFEIGKSRIADLLNAELSLPIRKSLTKVFPRSVFVNLSNDTIIEELDKKDDEYRIIFSLRCVESLSKERIEKILDLYIERDTHRYYNSIHWLDLGASLSKKQASAIVRREMVRRSQ